MATPQWITPAGFLGTITERVHTSTNLVTLGSSTFSLISGPLPAGLTFFNTGTISGTPLSVGKTIRSQFVVRAKNQEGITDRTFILDTQGPTDPVWITSEGYLPVGINNQLYVINREYIDYQLEAEYDALPIGQKLRYYIGDLEGELPPGVTLSEDGKLTGYVIDKLTLDYLSDVEGGYDGEKYDAYPYDHANMVNYVMVQQRQHSIPKIYQFYVTATDGASSSKRLFMIKVQDPSGLTVDTTGTVVDSILYSVDDTYLITPMWLTPVNLGTIRANNNQVIPLKMYDPYPLTGPVTYDWNTPTVNIDGSLSRHPPHFHLDPTKGLLYALLPYQPAFSLPYKFTIRLTKTDIENESGEVGEENTYKDRTFDLMIAGDVERTIHFITDSNLGSISLGIQSELKVVAIHTPTTMAIEYRLVGGSLPPGLTLAEDGTIEGAVNYDSETDIDEVPYGCDAFTIDGGLTTIDEIYTFTVQASDIHHQSGVEKTFYIRVLSSCNDYEDGYIRIYIRPYMKAESRRTFLEFITDTRIFESDFIYRPLDPEFGIQKEMRFVLEYGIEKDNLAVYASKLNYYFRRQQFYYTGLKTAVSKDINNNIVYEVIYLEILDEFGIGIDEMKTYLDSNFQTDEFKLPSWMRTIQTSFGAPLGYVKAIPLCYTLPGYSETIIKRINLSGFDFKLLSFTADRLLFASTLDHPDTKYLIFPSIVTTGTTLTDDLYLYGTANMRLDTEDGIPLDWEFEYPIRWDNTKWEYF
jgi:hypothetical protein